jgi:hypothetical protein
MKKINFFLLFIVFIISFAAPAKAVSKSVIHFLPSKKYLVVESTNYNSVDQVKLDTAGNDISISNGQLINSSRQMII